VEGAIDVLLPNAKGGWGKEKGEEGGGKGEKQSLLFLPLHILGKRGGRETATSRGGEGFSEKGGRTISFSGWEGGKKIASPPLKRESSGK